MVGATMFLGDIAFAQKNEESKKQIPPHAIEKVKGTAPANEKAQLPEQAGKNQGKATQKPVKSKTFVPGKTLPEQAKGKGKGLSTSQEKNNGIGNKKPNPNKESGTSDMDRKPNKESITSDTDPKPNIKTDRKKQGQSVKHTFQKKDRYNPILNPVKDQQRDKDTPSNEEEIPKGQMPNQKQRASGHGGKTNDRINPAFNGMNFLDDGYLWNLSYDIQLLDKPYQSQKIWMSNQWMNAPPLQPPQVAPLLETISSN